MIGGDGLFSFNSKLAVLVSEPDVQIKKVRHAHLILVNLPLHISPVCQLLRDSNHHRHMPCSLCLREHSRWKQIVVFLPGGIFYMSLRSHCEKFKSITLKRIMTALLVRVGHLICLSTFRRMLNMATLDQRWTGWTSSRDFGAIGVCGRPHLRSNSCLEFSETHTAMERDEWNRLLERMHKSQ